MEELEQQNTLLAQRLKQSVAELKQAKGREMQQLKQIEERDDTIRRLENSVKQLIEALAQQKENSG